MHLKNMPRRRVLWIVLFVTGIAALLYAGGASYVDGNGVLHDSFLMPVGAVMALLAIVVSAFDALLTLKQKI
ncbi:DUF3955 domain-containing protein [Kluyvera georgiana]|uniref:DUF3955 domain-containing protein n=1 Tax=Kluyvera georgiana TaxID=73098 RepID=UPI00321FACB3